MRAPIDYLAVGFEGNNFKGEILDALGVAVDNGTIAVLDLAVVIKNEAGEVAAIELTDIKSDVIQKLLPKGSTGLIDADDIAETADLIENNCSVGLVIIEQLWAKDLKKAIINANGVVIAEGRIHPEAAEELNEKGE